jgi:hypothetical protein
MATSGVCIKFGYKSKRAMRSILYVLCAVVAVGISALSAAHAQTPAVAGEPVRLSEDFSFRLGPHRDRMIQEMVTAISSQDAARQSLELHASNESFFSRAIDPLRFIPFKLSGSDMSLDDFFTPNYLRADYAAPAETHLFDNHK